MDAIDAGYDEITHINWTVMQAVPDSVIAVSNGIARFEGPGRFAKDLDIDAGQMKTLVSTMASQHVASDPTMVAFESLYVPENGDLSPSYAPFVGTLPPATERGFRQGGFAVPKDLTRTDYRASWAKMVQLLGAMHRAGVPIVAGTDGSGIELVHEPKSTSRLGSRRPARWRRRPSRRRGWPGSGSARDRSRSAKRPTSCWSRAIPRSGSATCATRGS